MSTALKLNVPPQGQKITIPERQARRARPADHPVHRRRRHRPGHLARLGARHRRRRAEGLRRQTQDPLDGGVRGPEVQRPVQHVAAGRNRHGLPRIPGVDQGPADHAGRRRHPLAERRAAADARSVRLPAPGALVQGRAFAGQGAGEGRHGDLPREHRRHLRRHRVRGRQRRQQEVPRAVQAGVPEAVREDPFPEHLRHRHQARVAGRHGAAVPLRHRVRDRQQAQEPDDRAQGQHHEVHGRRLP